MEKKETGNPRYLLLVEPDPNALNSLRDALSRADFVVRTASSGWVLLDFSDVIIHIFGSEQREFYQLERLWSRAPQVVRVL